VTHEFSPTSYTGYRRIAKAPASHRGFFIFRYTYLIQMEYFAGKTPKNAYFAAKVPGYVIYYEYFAQEKQGDGGLLPTAHLTGFEEVVAVFKLPLLGRLVTGVEEAQTLWVGVGRA
jgi:hypothetical protein